MLDEPLAIPFDEIQIDDKLNFIEELVEIMDREVKRLKQSHISIVNVCWNSKRGPEFTGSVKIKCKRSTLIFSQFLHPWQMLRRIMEIEPDIENMTLNEYSEYKAEMESTFNYQYYHEDIKIDKYHGLPPLHHCFQSAQPYTEDGLVSSNESDEVNIDSMTIAEYELYIAKQELSFEEVFGDLFRMGAKKLKGIKQKEAKVEDSDEGNMDDIWDITIEVVERLRLLLIPTVHTLPEPNPMVQPYVPDLIDDVIQPLIPQTIHTPQPNKDYVAPTTKLILDELLEECGDEILNITLVDEEAHFNPTRNIEELERLIDTDHESSFTEIKDITAKGQKIVITYAYGYVGIIFAYYNNYDIAFSAMT
ncbi:hypothetical protein Tco_1002054 [Tanacetum coccineum]|uniref:Reverse transcriptase domain-containing protein n=1 Tax=Tanacetum coccineum TaxID=301880 RepID=A0ABQ5F575_9ASTR